MQSLSVLTVPVILKLRGLFDDFEMVGLRSVAGQLTIRPHHVQLMTQMPGELLVLTNGPDKFLAAGEGLEQIE